MPPTSGEGRQLTYGEKAVGLTFNPTENPKVAAIKEQYAQIIDTLNNFGAESQEADEHIDEKRLFLTAIKETQAAAMWAVKAITWE